MDVIQHVERAYEDAQQEKSKVTPDVLALQGMSGAYTRHFYNNLCSMPSTRYLEIGSWKGSTLAAAMCNNNMDLCVGIDNWSEFGGPKQEFLAVFSRFKGKNNATFYENDCWSPSLLETLKSSRFNIYMFDGNHSEESHYNALVKYLPCLDDTFVYIVDDWNDKNVRVGTMRAIKDTGVTTLWKQETRLTFDNSHTEMGLARKTWWNGVGIFVLRKPHPVDVKSNGADVS